MGRLYSFSGTGGRMDIYKDKIVFTRSSVTVALSGIREIRLEDGRFIFDCGFEYPFAFPEENQLLAAQLQKTIERLRTKEYNKEDKKIMLTWNIAYILIGTLGVVAMIVAAVIVDNLMK